jgi:hypothetical protein
MNPLGTGGGAQATDREFIMHGIRQGQDIYVLTPKEIGATPVKNFDLAIISNAVTFPKQNLKAIIDTIPYVTFTHDYYFCRYRLYFPSQPQCATCRYLPFWKDLYLRSKLNMFMSPLHRDVHFGVIPELSKVPYACVPSAIKTNEFDCGKSKIKPGTAVCVNSLYGFKGRENLLAYAKDHPELSFTMIGGKEGEIELPSNCKYVGYKQREELMELFATHEFYIHLPSTPQPFERAPIEYLIANPEGKLIINQLVGARSYDWFGKEHANREEIMKHVQDAPKLFWREIYSCLKKQ